MIPDLFHWLLTGVKANEFTMATTTQFFDPRSNAWATTLLERFEIPTGMLGRIVRPGETLGRLTEQVAAATHLTDVEVVVPGTHDTASAVMAVPAQSASPRLCRGANRSSRLVLHQLGDLVADGRRSRTAGHQREMPG